MKVLPSAFLFINAIFLAVVLRQCTIIHGDGPGGFGELILKGLLAHISLACFACLAVSLRQLSREATGKLAAFCVALTTTIILSSAFALALLDACTNEKGYCRQGVIVLAHRPNNSFKPRPLRGSA